MLHSFVILSCLYAMCMSMPVRDFYSYSSAVGTGSGSEFSTANDGRVTGVRVFEYPYYGYYYYYYNYINGFQLQYDGNWTALVGINVYGNGKEMTVFGDEHFVQVSGKHYNGYISELMFVTSEGRSFKVGQAFGESFNFYPTHDGSELRFLSGRQNGNAITSIGAHWAVYNSTQPS